MDRFTTRNAVILVSIMLLFMLINFDPNFATIFIAIILVGAFIFSTDKKPEILLERPGNNRITSLLIVGAGFIGFYVLSFLVLSLFGFPTASIFSIYADWLGSLMAQFSPALADNPWLVLLAWGALIPFSETFTFFGVVFEWLVEMFKSKFDPKRLRVWMILALIAGIFTLFHMTAKGVTAAANAPLIMTFVFGFVSLVLVLYRRQLFEAVWLHIVVNSTAIIFARNLLPVITSPFVLAAIIIVIIYFAVRKVRLRI